MVDWKRGPFFSNPGIPTLIINYPFQISATDNKELEVDKNKMGCLQEVLGSKWAVNKMVLTNSWGDTRNIKKPRTMISTKADVQNHWDFHLNLGDSTKEISPDIAGTKNQWFQAGWNAGSMIPWPFRITGCISVSHPAVSIHGTRIYVNATCWSMFVMNADFSMCIYTSRIYMEAVTVRKTPSALNFWSATATSSRPPDGTVYVANTETSFQVGTYP